MMIYKKSNFIKYFFSLIILVGAVLIFSACETEDDIPPPSAYVEPEPLPDGDCTIDIIVPEIADGIDFECTAPATEFFGEKDGALTIEHAENPAKEGINTSEGVMMIEQTAAIQPWAGFFFNLASKIDFSEKQSISIKVYSPAAGQQINLKLEDAEDDMINTEVLAETTVANEWEEITFPFSTGASGKYDKIVLFFDFNGPKDATTVHYFDDIVLAEGGSTGGPGGPSAVPTVAAPTPTLDESIVISMFSDAYDDVPVDTWRTDWSQAVLLDTLIADNAVKKYSALNFVGIETANTQIDASSMTHFHVNVWTADATEIKIKLVDFGPNGVYDGPGEGDDAEHELTIESPAQQEWVSLDIPLADFTGLTTRSNLTQYIFSGAPTGANTIFMDNIYFYDGSNIVTAPTTAAPAPTVPEADVISLFSDTYTDVTVDTWRTDWSAADLEDLEIEGNATKKYSNLDFVGIETVLNQIDASEMVTFHTNVWTADATQIRIKIVDFGPNGAYDGPGQGDDTEHEITIENPEQNTWLSLDIPLSDFEGLTTKSNISQFIYAAQPVGSTTIFIDNVYFSK